MIKYSKIKRFLDYLNNIVMFFYFTFRWNFLSKINNNWTVMARFIFSGRWRTLPDESGRNGRRKHNPKLIGLICTDLSGKEKIHKILIWSKTISNRRILWRRREDEELIIDTTNPGRSISIIYSNISVSYTHLTLPTILLV